MLIAFRQNGQNGKKLWYKLAWLLEVCTQRLLTTLTQCCSRKVSDIEDINYTTGHLVFYTLSCVLKPICQDIKLGHEIKGELSTLGNDNKGMLFLEILDKNTI